MIHQIEGVAQNSGLTINEAKTKYIPARRATRNRQL